MNWIARFAAAALGMAWGCTTTNESHCGNLNGDETCKARDMAFPFCDRCSVANDGCSNVINTDPGCHEGDVGTSSSSGATSTVTTDTTTMTTSMTTSMTTTSMTTDATDDSTTGPPPTCPNGMIDEGEDCDGDDLNGADCVSRGFALGGTLACSETCRFDDSGCLAEEACGNHVVEPPDEDCEPADTGEPEDLNGQGCSDIANQFGGELACNGNCSFNTDGCCIADTFQCSDNVPCCGNCVAGVNLCAGAG